jgi:hypothetical protein
MVLRKTRDNVRRFVESIMQMHRSTAELGAMFILSPFLNPPEMSAFTDEAMSSMREYHNNIGLLGETDDLVFIFVSISCSIALYLFHGICELFILFFASTNHFIYIQRGHCENDVVSQFEIYISHLEHLLKMKTKVFNICAFVLVFKLSLERRDIKYVCRCDL